MVVVSWSRSDDVVVGEVSDDVIGTDSDENSSRIDNITFMTGSVVRSITAVGEVTVIVVVNGVSVVVVVDVDVDVVLTSN